LSARQLTTNTRAKENPAAEATEKSEMQQIDPQGQKRRKTEEQNGP